MPNPPRNNGPQQHHDWGTPTSSENPPTQQFDPVTGDASYGENNPWQEPPRPRQYQGPVEPLPQMPPQGYAANAYAYQEPEPQRSSKGFMIALIVVALLALVAIGAAVAIYLNSAGGASTNEAESTRESSRNSTRETTTRRSSEPSSPNYSKGVPDTSFTSGPFAAEVYRQFMQVYNDTHSPDMVIDVRSPMTSESYTMSCSPQSSTTVRCEGGNNAAVVIR